MSMPAPLSSALNRIWTPRASLSACARAVMLRDTRGLDLDAWQRLSYFPATPLCTLGWRFEGDAYLVGSELPRREASPEDPLTPIAPSLTLAGPFSAPSVAYSRGPSHGMMLLLMPDALQLLTGVEPETIANRVVDALTVLPPEWRTWAKGLFSLPDDSARLAAIEAFLEPRWHAVRPTRASLAARYEDWTRHLAMRAALTAPGRSLRQVERRIKHWAGQPMRELQGISRLERAFYARLAAEKDNAARWSDIAADCGYADQAHLTRATRRMTGFPPDELRRRIRDHEGFWAYRLWM